MIDVISTLTNGTHSYFEKGYFPPPKAMQQQAMEVLVNNEDHFFSDLPNSHSKKNTCNKMLITNE